MRVTRLDRGQAAPDSSPIFIGTALRQGVVAEGDANQLRVNSVTFVDGARNHWHRHGADQVLVVTEGRGIVASESQEFELSPGDVVLVPAGERHWHGAVPGSDFSHLSILTPGELIIEDEGVAGRS